MMEKIVVPTKFNKTGKRVLSLPLDKEKVCAPAYQEYRKAHRVTQDDWKRKLASAIHRYVETVTHCIASYVASASVPAAQKYKIVRFLAEQSLAERGPMNTTGPSSSQRWSVQLGDLSKLASVEEEAWETYVAETNKADSEREADIAKAHTDCEDMKQALVKEAIEYIRERCHLEDSQ